MPAIKLACPCCGGDGGGWTVPAAGETWWDQAGNEVTVITGRCSRCGSRVALDPSHDAVERIRAREEPRRTLHATRAAMAKIEAAGHGN